MFSGEEKGYPLQYSGLENSTDCIAHGAAKSWTRLSDFHLGRPVYLSPAKDRSSEGFTCLPGIRAHSRHREGQEMELEGVARAQLPASGLK